MSHMKTPWKLRGSATGTDYIHADSDGGQSVACFHRTADAEFAALAVNSHEMLVTALLELSIGDSAEAKFAAATLDILKGTNDNR